MSIDTDTKNWVLNAADERAVRLGCRMDLERAAFAIDWVSENCRLYEGEKAGELIDLMDWQKSAMVRIFGWVVWSSHHNRWVRRFREARIWAPKKQGKSPFLAAMELYLAFGEGEQGQKVYTAASNGDQARIAQLQAMMMIKQMPDWQDEFKVYENTYEIRQFSTNSKMLVLTSGTEKNKQAKEGLNGSVCWDELHVVPQTLVNRVSRAGISRAEPMNLAVSTAGLDRNCYGFQQFEYGRKVNSGEMPEADQNWRYFHVDYALPESVSEDEFDKDPKKYGAMCNPSWGKIIDPDEFVNDYQMSKRNTAEKRLFLVYRCTRWVDSVTRWIDEAAWNRAGEDYTWESLKCRPCYAGLDLSMTKDMTALVLCFPFEQEDGKTIYKLWPFFWLPETRIEQLAMNYPFRRWLNEGYLEATPEGRVSQSILKSRVRSIAKEVDIQGIFYDPWKAEDFTQSLCEGEQDEESGRMLHQPLSCTRTAMGQSIAKFSEPTGTFEHHLLGAEVRHPKHPILSWQASHVEIVTDVNRNMKPVKPKDQEYTGKSVDGIVASIMALAGAVTSVSNQPRIWRVG